MEVMRWCLMLVLLAACVSCDFFHHNRTLVVSPQGHDNRSCLEGNREHFCNTLEFALTEQCNNTRIEIMYGDEVLLLSEPVFLSHLHNLEIVGVGYSLQNITCSEGAGLSFESVENVTISKIAWYNCSVSHPTTVYNPSANLTFPNVSSALFFYRSIDINVYMCIFSSSYGSGITMYDVGGEVNIMCTNFTGNNLLYECKDEVECFNRSIGLYIEKTYCGAFITCEDPVRHTVYSSSSTYVIDNCVFDSNNNIFLEELVLTEDIISHKENRLISHGGGIGIRLTGNAQCNDFFISNCTFTRNKALWGGGVEVGIGDNCEKNSVQVFDSIFECNRGLTGGALRFAIFPPLNYAGFGANTNDNFFHVQSCHFSKNNAEAAGALSYISSRQMYKYHTTKLLVENATFEYNYADNSGTAVSLTGWDNEVGGFPTLASFIDCKFDSNYIQSRFTANQSHIVGFGTLSTHEIPLYFYGSTNFTSNVGTALVVSSTVVHMSDDVWFVDNAGVNGGAVHIMAKGWLTLGDDLHLSFCRNTASLNGGAIYSSYVIPTPFVDQRYCIFQIEDRADNISVSFDDNEAGISGNSIYLSSPGGCLGHNSTSLPFSNETIFHYDEDIERQLATAPGKIEFGGPANNNSGIYSMTVSLGQPFRFTPIMKDFFHKDTVGIAALDFGLDGIETGNRTIDYALSGQTLVQLNNTEITAPFVIIGEESSDQRNSTVISFYTSSFPSAVGYLHLNITSCRVGHVYNNYTKQCECFSSEELYCDPVTNLTCVKYGYWFGKLGDGSYTTKSCTSGFCKYTNGQCPDKKCNNDFVNYCKVSSSDAVCAYNRSGILCSECEEGFDFTYSALLCIPKTKCTAWSIVLSVALNIFFWIVVLSSIVLSLRLDLRLGSGYLYALIYYFGIVLHLTTNNFPSEFLTVLVYIFTGIFQINPRIFGLIQTCTIAGMNAMQHRFLFYIHPIFLGLMTLCVIGVGRCFPRFFPSISRESYGLRSLCIFLYLSFNALSETSLAILDFVTFSNNSGVYVALIPKFEYMDTKYHLPYAIVALCVELFIIIPLLFLLLFSPCLARIPRVNLTRFKPLLDEYQSCFKDNCRWFAGFYLVCRQFIFLFSLISFENSGGILFLQMLCIIVLVVHAVFQPYRKKWLNIMDTILLADLAVYSLMNGSTANVVLGGENHFRSFLVHVLILIPVVCFLILFGVSTVLVCSRWRKNKLVLRLSENMHMDESLRQANQNVNATYVASTSLPNMYVPMEREPLLLSDAPRDHGAMYSPRISPPPSQYDSKDPSSRASTPVSVISDAASDDAAKKEKAKPWYKSLHLRWATSKLNSKPASNPELKPMVDVDESLDAIDVRRRSQYTVSEAGPGAPALNDSDD